MGTGSETQKLSTLPTQAAKHHLRNLSYFSPSVMFCVVYNTNKKTIKILRDSALTFSIFIG